MSCRQIGQAQMFPILGNQYSCKLLGKIPSCATLTLHKWPCHFWACAFLHSTELWNLVSRILLLKDLAISLEEKDQEVRNSMAVLWNVLKIPFNHFWPSSSLAVPCAVSDFFCFLHIVFTGTFGFREEQEYRTRLHDRVIITVSMSTWWRVCKTKSFFHFSF